MTSSESKKGVISKFLKWVEVVGNKLPNPALLFGLFALLVLICSAVAAVLGLDAIHPVTGAVIEPVNLISIQGLNFILLKTVSNFTGFAPLGVVLVAMLGLGIAEDSGLIGACVRLFVLSVPPSMLTMAIVFCGVMSNVASEVGYVILIPLAGAIFLAAGRHPIAGMAAAFAGVSGGYSANLLIGPTDAILASFTQEAARIIQPDIMVSPLANYYFMIASTFILTAAGTWVTAKFVEPNLGAYHPEEQPEPLKPLSKAEKRGLGITFLAVIPLVFFFVWSLLPEGSVPGAGFLRDKNGGVMHSSVIIGIITIIFIVASYMGLIYGLIAKTMNSQKEIMDSMYNAIRHMVPYIVLVFFAAQFVAYFKESNLGLIIAVEGANFLKGLGLGAIPLLVSLVIFTAFINLFMGSASAKWAIMAPVFVPMFMLLGYTPEVTQVAYRIGDSTTNIISPMMSFLALIITFFYKYDKKSGIGTIAATMLPYSVVFLIFWSIMLAGWIAFGWPVGPDAGIHLN